VYIDAFAGAGLNISRWSGDFVQGSPLNALQVVPPFEEFFFIDLDSGKANLLRSLVGPRSDVQIYEGDANEILLKEVFPKVRYQDYRRGLCLLDPYGLHLRWEVVKLAGQLRTIDMFLNFPIMDMNRNSLWRNPERVDESDRQRMNAFWGGESWRQAAYRLERTLFGDEEVKQENLAVVNAYCDRLRSVADFGNVATPLPMRNKRGAVVYYLLFAAQKQVAENIVESIFTKYQTRGLA